MRCDVRPGRPSVPHRATAWEAVAFDLPLARLERSRWLLEGIDPDRIPAHVGCVMDGNGRWASSGACKRTEGHAAGEEALFDTVDGALELGIEWLTVYAFSTENWRRPVDEVRYLMGFNEAILDAARATS